MFLSKPCNVSDYGVIYGGVQKNVGPAGLAIVIIREDLINENLDPHVPIYCRFDTHANNGSMYNPLTAGLFTYAARYSSI